MHRNKVVIAAGAAVALASAPMAGLAAPADAPAVPPAASYADLLQPIPNAVARLQVADLREAAATAQLIPAQYDHHHHHYVRHDRRWYISHGYYWFHGQWVLRPPPHHHHHHNYNY